MDEQKLKVRLLSNCDIIYIERMDSILKWRVYWRLSIFIVYYEVLLEFLKSKIVKPGYI